ncbi:AsnC family transcriptional regulator [Bifidobacterium sp. DSM 109958]|uniref:AsnC family transcriptional regulator n=1 Tax=Bifidobacterium moraviense TaxID=2675323 RepID=A0A7Y0F1S3_9BIFI|nr:Lrp/AsnC family transcriptional regulator [Bifidobacterium sp. DSM 109958]NMM99476.1 AsnC family transcriptional regulator [Bifidobacterium sp. DSM 109958]
MTGDGVSAQDLLIVSALQRDGRMPFAALADLLGMSVYAVTERYRRLVETGLMSVVPVVNPLAFVGYRQIIVGLRVNGCRDEALAMLKSMDEVTYVVCALGDADVIAEAVVRSARDMDRFLKHDLRLLPGLERIQVFSCDRLILDDHNVSVVNRLLASRGERGLMTKTDANVGCGVDAGVLEPHLAQTFNVLEEDGRASLRDVGERLGVTHAAVRGRIRKLEDAGLMRIMATVSPMRLGGFRQAFLGLALRPPQLMDPRDLAGIDEVTYVMSGVGPGGADYLVEVIADDDASLWRVIDESIRTLPGVEQVWWASTVSVEKESYRL